MLRVSDSIRDGIRPGIPQPADWQRIGNQIVRLSWRIGHFTAGGTGVVYQSVLRDTRKQDRTIRDETLSVRWSNGCEQACANDC